MCENSQYDFVNEYYKNLDNILRYDSPKKPVESNFNKDYHAYADAMSLYDSEMIQYKINKLAQMKQQNELLQKFKTDLLEYLDITNHSKANELYRIAWDSKSAYGLNEVADYAEELSELLS